VSTRGTSQLQKTFNVLFDKGEPIGATRIKDKVTHFSASYNRVVKEVIDKSVVLNRETFKFSVATLLPNFKMTRSPKGAFYGLKREKDNVIDPNQVLDVCWVQTEKELLDIRNRLIQHTSNRRSRAVLELPSEQRECIIKKLSELFDKLEWTIVHNSNIGRVGASKILFAIFPEIALPVDNDEWDYVFRTHSYEKVLSTMVNEIMEWEKQSNIHLETLDPNLPTTLVSVYNVMAMEARP
jgi:hypothetical protein